MKDNKLAFRAITALAVTIGFLLPWVSGWIRFSGYDVVAVAADAGFENDAAWALVLLVFPISGLVLLIRGFVRSFDEPIDRAVSGLPLLTIIVVVIWIASENPGIMDIDAADFEDLSLEGIGIGFWLTVFGSLLLPIAVSTSFRPEPDTTMDTLEDSKQSSTPSKPKIEYRPILKTVPQGYFTRTHVVASGVIIFLYLIELMPWERLGDFMFANLTTVGYTLIPFFCVYIILCPLFIDPQWRRGEKFAKHFVFWVLLINYFFGIGRAYGNLIEIMFSAYGIALLAAAFLPFEKRLVPWVVSQIRKANERTKSIQTPQENRNPSRSNRQEKQHFCGNCGNRITGGIRFCPNCGSKQ